MRDADAATRTGWAANPVLNALVPWISTYRMIRQNFDATAEHELRTIEVEWLGFAFHAAVGRMPKSRAA